jgi:transposase InsO family protein
VRFQFVAAEKANYPVNVLCRVLGVSRSGFYAWLIRKPSQRASQNQALQEQIGQIHRDVKQRYGSPRMHRELLARGYRVGRHRIARLMRAANVHARRRRCFVRTTMSRHGFAVAENLVMRNFTVRRTDRVWASDITYVPTREGWLYLAVVLDLCSRFVVGWATSSRIDGELVLNALDNAVRRRRPPRGLIHHSDRGSQYAAHGFRRALKRHGMRCSMSRKADCWDNAPTESFFGTLKAELVNDAAFESRQAACDSLFEYIELFYNRQRLHSALDYQAPATYEMKLAG